MEFKAPTHINVYDVLKEVQERYEAYVNCEYEDDETADILIELKDLCVINICAFEMFGTFAKLDTMKEMTAILDYPT